MIVTSSALVNGVFDDLYGHRGHRKAGGAMVTYSLPILIKDSPAAAVSYAIVMEDKDAVPVCGFSWIHWLVANLQRTELKADESLHATDFIQGTNSWSGKLGGMDRLTASFYGGMSPPDRTHLYEIHVFALDCMLNLQKGFYMNELYHAMEGHILDCATLKGFYHTL